MADSDKISGRILDSVARASTSAADQPGVPNDDEAWTALARRLHLDETTRPHSGSLNSGSLAANRTHDLRRLRIRRLVVGSTALAACLAVTVWLYRPQLTAVGAGEQTTVSLADGSTVVLNSGSRLRHRARFLPGMRRVHLDGEAFFDVAHDAKRPFVVETSSAEVTVLGTRFNVRARSVREHHETTVTLIEGSVRVEVAREVVTLSPGETSVVAAGLAPRLRPDVDAKQALAWRTGGFSFSNQPLGDILDEVTRRFGAHLEIDPNVDVDSPKTIHYATNASAEAIVHDLCLEAGLRYREIAGGFAITVGP